MIRKRFPGNGAVAAVCVLALLWPSAPTLGQSASGMAGKAVGADAEVVNAAQAAEEALKAAATKGEATRGASGAISTLLTESDTLLCSAWIVSFRVRYRNMVIEDADPRALRAMQNLMEKVEKACEKVLNPPQGGGTGVIGGAGPAIQPAASTSIYPECPECDPLKEALDQRTYDYQRAQYELYKAMKRSDLVDSILKSKASPADKRGATGGETSEQAEQVEARKRADVANAKSRMDDAQQALVACLERCHKRVRGQQVSMGGSRKKLAIGGAALAAIGVVAVTAGGGGGAAAGPSTTPNPAPTPAPDPQSSGIGLCAGAYRSQFVVSVDPAGHRGPIGLPPEIVINVTTNPFQARANPPWVNADGAIVADGTFTANGTGVVAGRPGVQVRFNGKLTGCGNTAGILTGSYVMGAGGELPTGQSITYAVNGSK
jgi:hypothetical protein